MMALQRIAAASLFVFLAAGASAFQSFHVTLPSVELSDQLGRHVDLGQELMAPDGVAVLSFFFQGCKAACPVTEAEMHFLDTQLAPHARLLTLTLDPLRDTVERLAHHAAQTGASARWRFLTGDREAVDALLDRLDVRFGALDEHPTVIFLAVHGQLFRLNGQPDAREIVALIKRLTS